MAELKSDLLQLAQASAAGLRVVPAENLHITLKFMGRVTHAETQLIREVMDCVAAGTSSFRLTLEGLGFFHNAIWIGVTECQHLMKLAQDLEQRLANNGFTKSRKPYFPHLTMARIRHQARLPLTGLQQRYGNQLWGHLHVTAITLYDSLTVPTGVKYSIAYRRELLSLPDCPRVDS